MWRGHPYNVHHLVVVTTGGKVWKMLLLVLKTAMRRSMSWKQSQLPILSHYIWTMSLMLQMLLRGRFRRICNAIGQNQVLFLFLGWLLFTINTWLFLSKVVASGVYKAYLQSWLASFINDKKGDNSLDSKGFVEKLKKELQQVSPDERLNIISSLIFSLASQGSGLLTSWSASTPCFCFQC